MSKFLRVFDTYNNYNSNINTLKKPNVSFCRDNRGNYYNPNTINLLCDNNVVAQTFQCTAAINGKKITNNISWQITNGNAFATISQNGLLTILNNANNSNITIKVIHGVTTSLKNCTVTYDQGSSVITNMTTTENEDGTTTESSIITRQFSDGTTTTQTNTTTYDEEGEKVNTTEKMTQIATDGSYNSITDTFDTQGNKTNTINEIGDTQGNIDTQNIEYDQQGNPTVTGYAIDTTNNQTGNGKSITQDQIDTDYYAFDTTSAFELLIHFKFEFSKNTKQTQATILNAKRADPEPWYGFDIRKNNNSQLRLGTQFETGQNTSTHFSKPDNIYKIKIVYNPTVAEGQNTFVATDLLTNKTIFSSKLKFPDLQELKYLTISIGCALDKNGNQQRWANVDVYEFYVKKL